GRQVEAQCVSSQDNSHVPVALGSQGLGLRSHSGGDFVTYEIGQIKVTILIKRNYDVVSTAAWARQDDFAGPNSRQTQIHAVFGVGLQLAKDAMPIGKSLEGAHSPRNAIGVRMRG